MTADQYVEAILAKYAVPRGPTSPAERFGAAVGRPLRAWTGQQLSALEYSGSYAKETGVHGNSDVDVFISLKSDTTSTLKDRYNSSHKPTHSSRERSDTRGRIARFPRLAVADSERFSLAMPSAFGSR
jgi:hypothetical protein